MQEVLNEIEETEAQLQQVEEDKQAVDAQLKETQASEKATPDGDGGTVVCLRTLSLRAWPTNNLQHVACAG